MRDPSKATVSASPSQQTIAHTPSKGSPTTGESVRCVASSSYMRMTDGRWPAASVARNASMPASTSGKASVRNRRRGGSGTISSVARVMIPSVPSEPTKSCVRSGPTAWRGTATVSISSPLASATRSDSTRSSILP
jgi:hypothetical protein